MSKGKIKFYTVWKGRQPGIYKSWDECQQQIKGFEGAQFKSFESSAEAEQALKKNYWDYISTSNTPSKSSAQKTSTLSNEAIILDSICVDAACSGNPGLMEYRCVDTRTKEEIFASPKYPDGTNNIGEFLALVHALALCKNKKVDTVIYTDSKTAMSWVKNKKVKTNLTLTTKNKVIFELIDRAIQWLNLNSYSTKILKWETEIWGEIPADYGRK